MGGSNKTVEAPLLRQSQEAPDFGRGAAALEKKRVVPGLAGAVLFSLPIPLLSWQLCRWSTFTGLAGALGCFLVWLGFRLFTGGRNHWLGPAMGALLPPLAALPGLWWGYGERIMLQNQPYGCTMEEALELLPQVLADPYNRGQVLMDFLSPLLLAILTALLLSKYNGRNIIN